MEEGSSQDSDETDETDPDVPVETEPKWGSDFALGRVPRSMRYSWVSMAMEQVAQGGCIAVVVIGAQLGHKMTKKRHPGCDHWQPYSGCCLAFAFDLVCSSCST